MTSAKYSEKEKKNSISKITDTGCDYLFLNY